MPAKLERCVKDVSAQKGVKNAWAICQASLNKTKRKTKAKRKISR